MTGRSRSCGSAVELLEHLEAVHLRHLHVEQQQVERFAPQHLERDAAVLGRGDAVALQLEAARQQQPVDLVVVDDQQARRPLSQLTHGAAPSAPRRRARIPASSASSGAPSAAPHRRRGRRARARAPCAPSASAPKVLLFDLSECAARRNASASPRGERAAQLGEHRRRFLRGRCRRARRRTRRRRCPAARRRSPRSIVGAVMSAVLCAPARWFSASTSRSTRIGLVR